MAGALADADRLYQVDYQVTEVRVSNPTDLEGTIDFVFYEARGDGNYYRADWASGRWTAPPRYQRYYRPDPSREYGSSFITYGWFEVWLSLDALVMDVELSAISRNMISGGSTAGTGGVVQNISQRTVVPVPNSPLDMPTPMIPIDEFAARRGPMMRLPWRQ